MESVIYYFSATGNSLRIANIMAERDGWAAASHVKI